MSNLKVRKLKKNTQRTVECNMAFTNFKRKKAEICKFCGRLGSKNLQFKNLSLMGKQILRMVSKLVVRNGFQSACMIPKVYIVFFFKACHDLWVGTIMTNETYFLLLWRQPANKLTNKFLQNVWTLLFSTSIKMIDQKIDPRNHVNH